MQRRRRNPPPAQEKPDEDVNGKAKGQAEGSEKDSNLDSVFVFGKRWLFNRRTRYAHTLPEVDGPTITVTKKTSVVQLNDVPTIIDNNQRELFDRLPGIVLAEQQNPTELNLSYRGLGNPQESEYILLMQAPAPRSAVSASTTPASTDGGWIAGAPATH